MMEGGGRGAEQEEEMDIQIISSPYKHLKPLEIISIIALYEMILCYQM